MTFYRDEKKRIGNTYKIIMFVILFINFVNLMSSVVFPKAGIYEEGWVETVSYIPFMNVSVWAGAAIIFLYMNHKLFWIREQGEKAFLPKKYEITPLTMQQIYAAKFRIMIHAAAAYLFFSVVCYYFILLSNRYPVMDWGQNALEIAAAALFEGGFLLLFLIWDIGIYFKLEKEN